MSFQINALPYERFQPYFDYSSAALDAIGARLSTVETSPGTPCRVSLADAEVGETVLLMNYQHQRAASPFQASHAIYIRKDATQPELGVDEIPKAFRSRVMSVRGFDNDHYMIDAILTEDGQQSLEGIIESMFNDPKLAYIHLHYAAPGCFAANVSRA